MGRLCRVYYFVSKFGGDQIPGNLRRISRKNFSSGFAELIPIEIYREGVPWTLSCVSILGSHVH